MAFYTLMQGCAGLIGGNLTDITESITVALIGIAGILFTGLITLIINMRQEKKDTKAIMEKLICIGGKTQDMPSKADHIKEDTTAIRRNVAEAVLPSLKTTKNISDGVKALVDELNYQKGVRDENSIKTLDSLKAGMDTVFEENAKLNKTISVQAEEIGKLKAEKHALEQQNQALEKQLADYKRRENSRSDPDRDER